MTTTSNPTNDTTVLIVGATGWLGRKIAREVAATGHPTRIGLRDGAAHPDAGDFTSAEPTSGSQAQVVELDLTRPETFPAAVEGVDVIVSAIQGGPELLVDGQGALAAAAAAAGVRRIFPSDFAVDFTKIPDEDHLFFAWRRQGQQAIAATGLAQTNTYNGAFTEMLLPQPFLVLVDWDRSLVNYWGDPDQVYDFTTTDDVARYVAAAAVDPQAPNGALRIAGDSLAPTALVAAVSRATGKEFALEGLGSLEDLNATLEQRQAESPHDPMSWSSLQYFRSMASGSGTLHELDNARYPRIEPVGVEDFLTTHQP